jgi:hypothetical protein
MTAPAAQKAAALLWLIGAGAMLYLCWVFASRYVRDSELERNHATRASTRYRPSPSPPGTAVRIIAFYGSPAFLVRGERAIVCYGVENARSVSLQPAVEAVKPAANRCFSVTPVTDTTYELTAEGADGTTVAQSFKLRVDPPPPEFTLLATGPEQIDKGDRYSVCYGVKHVVRLRLDPLGMSLPPAHPRHCVMFGVGRPMQFTLTAWGEDGRTVAEKWSVRLR